MRRFVMLLCVFIFAVFIGAGIINSDSDPPCAELTEILNQTPAGNIAEELSQAFPNPFNAAVTEDGIYEVVFSASVPIGYIVYGITSDEAQGIENTADMGTGFSTKEESALLDVYFSKASQTGVIETTMGAGQNPKDIVVGSVDSFIYNGELDVTGSGQVAYPLIA